MAVYFAPARQPGFWEKLAGSVGAGLLNSVVGGMFERDSAARDVRQRQKRAGVFADAMSGAEPTRENFMRAAAASGMSGDEVEPYVKMYGNRFAADDSLYKGGALADVVNGLSFDVENDPQGALRSGLVSQGYGLKPQDLMKFTHPGYTYSSVDAGDRAVQSVFNPRNGKLINSKVAYGRNPTKVYESDSDTRQAEIAAAAQRHTADMGYAKGQIPSFSPVYGESGEVLSYNNRTGGVSDTGARSYPRGQGQGSKPMSAGQRLSLGQSAVKSVENLSSQEAKWNYLVKQSGGDVDALRVMAEAVFSDGSLPKAADEFLKTGAVRSAGAADPVPSVPPVPADKGNVPAADVYFPRARLAEYAAKMGVSPEEALRSIEAQGFVVR